MNSIPDNEDSKNIEADLRFIENDRQSVMLPAYSTGSSKKMLQPLVLPAGAFLVLAVFVMIAINITFPESDLTEDLNATAPPHPLTCLGPPYLYVTIHDKVLYITHTHS